MNIPTAEEFALENMQGTDLQEIERALIEFAKLHVEAALEAADKTAECNFPEGAWDDIEDKSFILNSYPLTNIK